MHHDIQLFAEYAVTPFVGVWIETSLKEYKDSAAIYHSKCDSLASVISKISKDKAYVEKQLSKTDRAFLNIGKIASVCLFIGILAFLGLIYWKLKLHKRS